MVEYSIIFVLLLLYTRSLETILDHVRSFLVHGLPDVNKFYELHLNPNISFSEQQNPSSEKGQLQTLYCTHQRSVR